MATQPTLKIDEDARTARSKAYRERIQQTFQLEAKVGVTLRGTDYTLEFTNRAVKDVLLDTGVNLLRQTLTQAQMEDPDILGSLLFRGLQYHHPDLTQESSDGLFTARHYLYVISRLQEALDLFFPDMSDLPMPEQAPEGETTEDPS